MVQLCYKHIRVILTISGILVGGVLFYVIAILCSGRNKAPAVELPPRGIPARVLLDGQYTRFNAPEGNYLDMYRFVDPENGNTVYWWGGQIVVVPGKEAR